MTEKAAINVRIDKEVKKNAEKVLNKLGIPMSVAIDMYLRQIALTNSIPFSMSSEKRNSDEDTALMVAEATAQYEVTKRDWEDKIAQQLPDWMKMDNMTKAKLEKRFDKRIKSMKDGKFVEAKEAFNNINKKLGL